MAAASGKRAQDDRREEVSCLLERLTDCEAVEAVSMDMSRAFREAVQLCLPRARIVADHFHVIQHESLAVKTRIGRWAKKAEGKTTLYQPPFNVAQLKKIR